MLYPVWFGKLSESKVEVWRLILNFEVDANMLRCQPQARSGLKIAKGDYF